jgi:hypothetical protein
MLPAGVPGQIQHQPSAQPVQRNAPPQEEDADNEEEE